MNGLLWCCLLELVLGLCALSLGLDVPDVDAKLALLLCGQVTQLLSLRDTKLSSIARNNSKFSLMSQYVILIAGHYMSTKGASDLVYS